MTKERKVSLKKMLVSLLFTAFLMGSGISRAETGLNGGGWD
jgi:hypothetical protein